MTAVAAPVTPPKQRRLSIADEERAQRVSRVRDQPGFRHSDTALVTEDGIELATYYPRDLGSLIV